MIRSHDLGEPYRTDPTSGTWAVNEQLYPESRGYSVHFFKDEASAKAFILEVSAETEKEKAAERHKNPHQTPVDNLITTIEAQNTTIQGMVESFNKIIKVTEMLHGIIADQERRIQTLEKRTGLQ